MNDKAFARNLRMPDGNIGKELGKLMNSLNHNIIKYTYEQLKVSHEDKILEIGCGNALNAIQILANTSFDSYTGIDKSKAMVLEARNNLQDVFNSSKFEFLTGSVPNQLKLKKSYNKICSINTLYFFQDLNESFKSIWNVMDQGGNLCLAFRPKNQLQKSPFSKYYFNLYSTDEIVEELKNVGFYILDVCQTQDESYNESLDIVCINALKQ